jgi:hypothetical protein
MQTSREMGMTHKDFFRTFPVVAQGRTWRMEGQTVVLDTGEGTVSITLGPQGERRIALLVLPVTQLEFRFQGYDQAEMDHFMARFDLAFRRGGG